jgi:hypothetical protein
MPGERFQKIATRRKAKLILVYYRDRLTGDVFAIVK